MTKNDQLDAAIVTIVKVADPDTIILFGSRARGDNRTGSDFDLCVLKSGVEQRRKLSHVLYRALYGVGAAIDLIVDTPERFEELKTNCYLIYHEIARSGRVIYERSTAR